LELFGTQVMPEFTKRAEAHEQAKIERLAADIEDALRRRDPPRVASPDYVIAPMGSGPPAKAPVGEASKAEPARGNGRAPAWRRRLEKRGEKVLRRFVHRSSDRRLERTVGSDTGLRLVFAGMTRRFRADKAAGFSGDILYELSPANGDRVKNWTVSVNGRRATARNDRPAAPAVTISMSLADFARLIARDLDPGKALLQGRLQVDGDFNVLTKLGEMFGEPAP
jgi:putative sterol carrier protein